jgi:ribosomal protein L7/L12
VIELVQADRKLEAIKLDRELTGLGLAEAKDAVEQLADTYRPTG